MGIQKDAEEILVYLYRERVAGKSIPQQEEIIKITKWDSIRVILALKYLVNKRWVYGEDIQTMGEVVEDLIMINDISPEGIDVIENQKEFKKHFNHIIDLKFYKYSWGASER